MIDALTFETIYSEMVKSATAYVARKAPSLDSDAIVADAFANVWAKRDTMTDANVRGYVQTAVHNTMVDRIRTNRLQIAEMDDAAQSAIAATSDHNPFVGMLADVTAILTEDQRRVVMMRLDYQFSEIATILATEKGITLSASDLVKATDSAKKLYNRARATMRRTFPERVAA